MTTSDKDFKVKNGLQVIQGGVFGGTVEASTPTLPEELTTKAYVDAENVSNLQSAKNYTDQELATQEPTFTNIFMLMGV